MFLLKDENKKKIQFYMNHLSKHLVIQCHQLDDTYGVETLSFSVIATIFYYFNCYLLC